MLDKFDRAFIKVAAVVSELSKDPSSKIGAVITGDNRQIISQGYNGFPRGIVDDVERYNNREEKYKFVIHAEANAIYNALSNGSRLKGTTIYIDGLPCCNECAKAIIQCGITTVIQRYSGKLDMKKWQDSSKYSKTMFDEAGVKLITLNEERK